MLKYLGVANRLEIAMQLLKNEWDYVDDNVLPENDLHYIYPNEQMWNDEADDDLKEKTNALWEYIESMHPQDKLMMLNQMDNPMLAMGINTDPRNRADMTDEENEKYINDAIWEMMFDGWQDSGLEMPGGIDYDLGGNRKSGEEGDPVRAHAVAPSQWKKLAGEPMNIAMRLLKEEDSVCPHCRGTGKDPNQKGIPEEGIAPGECEPCDGSGMRWVQTPLDERGFPIESYEEDDPNWQDSIETGEPMDIAMRLLKNEKQWKEEAKFLPTRDLEGQSMGVTEALVSHPNFKLFEEAGHPEDRLEEFFGTRIAEEWRRGRVFEDEWAFREQEEDDQLREMGLYEEPITSKTQDKLDYAPDVFMEHKRLNMKTLPGGGS